MELLRVLNDVHDDKVSRRTDGVITVRGDTQVDVHEQADYVATVRRLLGASWVMESNRRRAGAGILRLTTLGELRRLDMLAAQPSAVAS